MKEELYKTDENGCTSFQDILKAMNLDAHEDEYDIVMATEDDQSFNDEEKTKVEIKFMPTSHLNY